MSFTHTGSTPERRSFVRSRGLVPLLLASLGVIAVGIFFLVRVLGGGEDVHEGGPLALPAGARAELAYAVDLKAPYSWGLIFLDYRKNDESVHVEAFDLIQSPSGLTVLGSYAVQPGRTGTIGFIKGYNPKGGSAVEGLDIPPRSMYEVVVGLKAPTKGRYAIQSAHVRYTSGGTTYQTTLRSAISMCAPTAAYPDGCPWPSSK
jgi:hypothetical protein